MFKIAFFDIDGTILDFGAPSVTPPVRNALNTLQRNGIRIFLATGRAPYILPHFEGITFDGVMCFNGSLCYDRKGDIFSNELDKADMWKLIGNAKSLGLPVLIAGRNRMGSNFFNEDLEEYMQISENTCNVISPDEYKTLGEGPVYQLMVGTRENNDEALLAGTTHLRITRWWDQAMDVIPRESGKDLGMKKVLAHYGFTREESLAFGDGGNDLDMIRFAGCGVAMGNAVPEVKDAADYVTECCADDGVYTALRHFKLV